MAKGVAGIPDYKIIISKIVNKVNSGGKNDILRNVKRNYKIIALDARTASGEVGGEFCDGEFVAEWADEAAEVGGVED